MEGRILKAMDEIGLGGVEVPRKKLMAFLEVSSAAPGPTKLFERALERLVKQGRLLHPVQGWYGLPKAGSDKSDTPPDPEMGVVSESGSGMASDGAEAEPTH